MFCPFSCLFFSSGKKLERHDLLIAASGSSIYSFDLASEQLLSVWPPQQHHEVPALGATDHVSKKPRNNETDSVTADRHVKRQKVSGEDFENGFAEIVSMDETLTSQHISISRSPVIKLTGTSNGHHIIAVTEDKCIRVLNLSPDGILAELSERQRSPQPMPKRPCAIVMTPDENTILCADKFGDVYSLPLVTDIGAGQLVHMESSDRPPREDLEDVEKPFMPAANSRTVHTLRNQKALQNQQKITNKKARKKNLDFHHQLLLGHVSLLTDLVCVSLQDKRFPLAHPRNYILTSDRDEHIRVSRGIPQAYIIEGYCLGHSEFVSKLCIPYWLPQLLVSGGGDDYLLLWDWLSGKILQRVDLRGPVLGFRREHGSSKNGITTTIASQESSDFGESAETFETAIAISGIWAMQGFNAQSEAHQGEIIVACEGLPALFIFCLDSDARMSLRKCCPLQGNVMDLAVLKNQHRIIFSIDHYHVSSSTIKVASPEAQLSRSLMGSMSFDQNGHWKQAKVFEEALQGLVRNAKIKEFSVEYMHKGEKPLNAFLYNIENLRKRGQEEHD